jgi:3-oxoacyl-[acyl-carrier-protein] synthase-3
LVPAGGSRLPTSVETVKDGQHFIQMNGREVFRFATRVMAQATQEAVEKAQLTLDDVHLIVPHQANRRIIEAAVRGLDISLDRVAINIERYGNTSTASIPIAAVEAVDQGRLHSGDKVVFVGFGGGLTWGASVVQWSDPFPTRPLVLPVRYRWLARLRSVLLRLIRHIEGIIWGRDANGR